ncbi:hypothetical protein Ngar_c17030 [Candidatus Nitrososphaera gargensis Ga9.2]|uniref:Uncharacterized protein n=2 Tax=Candidatus Nitrososphaera gargensis TaxID=497727 RepID=K0IBI3_NITGG|nr:hypothetical protein Ngar_c17030 [Candidatus Nitrososphaera gargensis Ga9.2]
MMLIEPAAEIEELKHHWQKIQELKRSILDKSDIQEISGKAYVKRSGWRKLQSAFAISDRIVSKEREDQDDGHFLWRVEVEAYHVRTGRSAMGIGTCSTKERKFAHPDHDILATAHTRAKNRAISDLIGLGELSFEEIDANPEPVASQHQPPAAPAPTIKKEEMCSCGHSRPLHISDGKALYCMQCVREGKEDVKCNLPIVGR